MHAEEHGLVVRHCLRGYESVLLHSLQGVFRKDRVGAANDAGVLGKSLSVDDDGKGAEAVQLLPSSFVGHFRFRGLNRNRRMNDRRIKRVDWGRGGTLGVRKSR